MAHAPKQLFNPCSLEVDEQIPAKIWELLRRNQAFRSEVDKLTKLDAKERKDYQKTGNYHGTAWHKSWRLVKRVAAHHSFAGVALQWLVPEPLFRCYVNTWPRGTKWKQRPVFIPRTLREGDGFTPNLKDKSWVWRNPAKRDVVGHRMRRGPEVDWTTSRFKRLRDWVNPLREWRKYRWPFTVEHIWPAAPAEFKRKFQFIWRKEFDSRPKNPLTNDRSDSPTPAEVTFFHDWNLANFRKSEQITHDDFYHVNQFIELASDYRLFAIPKTILTKGSSVAMGTWLANELKKGSDLYGDLLTEELLDEGELLGLNTEWNDWLAYETNQTVGGHKSAYFYLRRDYMESLVSLIYPQFNLAKLLAKPTHRAHGKKYSRKIRNE